ncbi:hypothetical protein [Arthrobacter sp. ov118]|uniref:hypothetical protein n=1 Tax=Arthrobacter sp. ov118 TaxID=1761747 RepID=UPI0008E69238|nr:hypothetical protein [Arthrobacter sp. ov118]SFU11785.1 hypothetical protein SAMN04487915_111171 [Arthrobacter sp. ov118]
MTIKQTAPPAPARTSMPAKIIQTVFTASLLLVIVAGIIVVAGQGIGLIIGSGGLITNVDKYVAPWAFGAAAVVCISSLLSSYFTTNIQEQDD